MELVNRARTAYFSAARDETRSSALADVSRQWEMPVPLTETPEEPASFSRPLDNPVVNVDQKLGMIRLPRVQLDGATVQEAVDYLRSQARTHDATAMTAAERGVNISVDPGPADSVSARDAAAKRITLNLQNVPLREALEYVRAHPALFCGQMPLVRNWYPVQTELPTWSPSPLPFRRASFPDCRRTLAPKIQTPSVPVIPVLPA